MAELPSGTVTFLLTDVEGSTALWEQAPETMRPALAQHDAIFEQLVSEQRGVHIRPRGEGDSRFAVFASATEAVAAAVAIQRAFAAEDWPTPRPIKVRIGVHTGEAQRRDGDYYGSAVNRCARLRGIGHGGQILLSEATTALVRDGMPSGIRLLDLGRHRLKNLTEPERVSQIVAPDLPSESPPLLSLDARLATLYINDGDTTHAQALLEESAEALRAVGDAWWLAYATSRLGTLAHRRGDHRTARSLHEHGVALYRRTGEEFGLGTALTQFARYLLDAGDLGHAVTIGREALVSLHRMGDQWWTCRALVNLADAFSRLERPRCALELLGAVAGSLEGLGAQLPPVDQTRFGRVADRSRSHLREDDAEALFSKGRRMTLQQAITAALDASEARPGP